MKLPEYADARRVDEFDFNCPRCTEWLQAWPGFVVADWPFDNSSGSYEMAHGTVVLPLKCGPDPLPPSMSGVTGQTDDEWWGEDPDDDRGHYFLLVIVPHKGATSAGLVEVLPSAFRTCVEHPEDRAALRAALIASGEVMAERRGETPYPPDGFYGRGWLWICWACKREFTAGSKTAYNHVSTERTKTFLETLHAELDKNGPMNSVVINKMADDAGVNRNNLAKHRTEWVELGALFHDDYSELANDNGLPRTLGHFWRLSIHDRLTDDEALAEMRRVKG